MNLLENKEIYREFIEVVSAELGLARIQIEKDYMVSLLLKELSKIQSVGIVFKGGTSLSKCYDVINRFSEDIDISVQFNSDKVTESKRKLLKKEIVDSIISIGFELKNPDEIKSRRDFNKYTVEFPKMFSEIDSIDPNIII